MVGGLSMSKKRKRHTAEQVVKKLQDADAMLAAGKSNGEVLCPASD
jgi:putative transposase